MNNSLLPELWRKTIHKESCKEKTAEEIVDINGVNLYFCMLNFNLKAYQGQEKELKKEKF